MAYIQIRNIFAIMAPSGDGVDGLGQALERLIPHDFLKVGPGQWLASYAGTAKDLSDALGVTQGHVGTAIIIAAAGYYGRADSHVWEWINAKLGTLEYAS